MFIIFKSGADYVKISKKLPSGFEEVLPGSRCASLDGDADRLIYYSIDKKNKIDLILMDGDYISALFSIFLLEVFLKILYVFLIIKNIFSN